MERQALKDTVCCCSQQPVLLPDDHSSDRFIYKAGIICYTTYEMPISRTRLSVYTDYQIKQSHTTMKEVNQADQHVPGNHASSVAEALTRRLQLIKLDCNNLKLEGQAIHHQNTALKLRKSKFHAKLAALASQVALESEVMIDKNSNNAVGIYNEDKEFKLHW